MKLSLKYILRMFCPLLLLVSVKGQSIQSNQNKSKMNAEKKTPYTFQSDILPMLKKNCMPCHFEGGKVYGKLPFEEYKTVFSIRKRLHTRLKDEQITIVNDWIESGAKEQ